ncbi:MAG TPA: response regulator [Geminicoccaceae bacterium]|nr:response regulator [Geminicoccaceae bacterium]
MKPLRIAVAEDNWLAAEYLNEILASMGHEVVGLVPTGEDLVALVARERPDLALVDINLAGGCDGLTAAREIRRRFAVPAIAVTGHLTAAEAEAAGLLGLVAKPFTTVGLRTALAGATERLEDGGGDPGSRPSLRH